MGHVRGARRRHRRRDGGDRSARRRLPRHLDAPHLRQGVSRRPAQHAPGVEDGARGAGHGADRRRRLARPSHLRPRHEPGRRQVPGDGRRRGVGVQLAPLRRRRLLLEDRRRPRRHRHGDVGHARRHDGADVRRRAGDGHQPDRLRRSRPSQPALSARHGDHHGGGGQGEGLQAEPQEAAPGLGGRRRREDGDRRGGGIRLRLRQARGRHHAAGRHARSREPQGLRSRRDGAHPRRHALRRVVLTDPQPDPAAVRPAQHRPLLHGHRPEGLQAGWRLRGRSRSGHRHAPQLQARRRPSARAGRGRSGDGHASRAAGQGRPGAGRPDGPAPRRSRSRPASRSSSRTSCPPSLSLPGRGPG